MATKKNANSLICELKRKTRRSYSSEEKVRIIMVGIHGEMSIADLRVMSLNKTLILRYIWLIIA